jgi:putative toxin-antitoxin system antitoxin component (TIGR02293 family)
MEFSCAKCHLMETTNGERRDRIMSAQPARAVRVEAREGNGFAAVAEILGGKRVWKKPPTSKIELHDALLKGISCRALFHVFKETPLLPREKVADAIGVSWRSVQRYQAEPDRTLDEGQGARLWKFAEILQAATELQGNREAGERWLSTPARALDRRTPLEMMATPAGAEVVEELLGRLKYGVYT